MIKKSNVGKKDKLIISYFTANVAYTKRRYFLESQDIRIIGINVGIIHTFQPNDYQEDALVIVNVMLALCRIVAL